MNNIQNKTYDVVVVGAGIVGAGIARDAALRGMKVCLIDKGDIASGTSSASSKLIHGGLRYLEYGELSLVHESVMERKHLLHIAPHLVKPLGFVFPIFPESRRQHWEIKAGLFLYELLSGFSSPKHFKALSAQETMALEPAFNGSNLKSSFLYYDCQTDDARLTLETALDAARAGVDVSTYTSYTEHVTDSTGVHMLQLHDTLLGTLRTVRGHAVVFAVGTHTEQMAQQHDTRLPFKVRASKGIHIVFRKQDVSVEHALTCLHPKDGRLFFVIPWNGVTYVGTTDTDETSTHEVFANAEEVDYLIEGLKANLPQVGVGPEHVIATWAGLRTLLFEGDDKEMHPSDASREEKMHMDSRGLMYVCGGKLTTYRQMSEHCLETLIHWLSERNKLPSALLSCTTKTRTLAGMSRQDAERETEQASRRLSQLTDEAGVSAMMAYGPWANHLASMIEADPSLAMEYGDSNQYKVQVAYALAHEHPKRLVDMMVRRTQLYYRLADAGLSFAEEVAHMMSEVLDWSPERRELEIGDYMDFVKKNMAWKQQF